MDEMQSSDGQTREREESVKQTGPGRMREAFGRAVEKGKLFYERNQRWIKPLGVILLIGTVVGVEESRNVKLRKENEGLREDHRIDLEVQDMLANEVLDLRELMREKDARHAQVASDDLRRGGSLGGQDLVGLREYKRAQSQLGECA